jgi:hypothetical protein
MLFGKLAPLRSLFAKCLASHNSIKQIIRQTNSPTESKSVGRGTRRLRCPELIFIILVLQFCLSS